MLADVLDMRVAPVAGDVPGLVGALRAGDRALAERLRADEVVGPDRRAARHHAQLHPVHRGLHEAALAAPPE